MQEMGKWLCIAQVHNPCNGEVIARIASMKANETSTAIAAAAAQWPSWSGLTAKERSKIMRRCIPNSSPASLTGAAAGTNKREVQVV